MRRRDVLWGVSALGLLGAVGCQTSAMAGPVAADEAGVEAAFLYAFPLYEIARTGQNRAAQPGLNRLGHRAVLADDTMRAITAPNNDTIYSSGQLEVSGSPIEVIAPTDLNRYFNITFMDAFTDNFAGIGTRLTQGRGGKFWIVGPQWQGVAPGDTTVLHSSTNDVWMLARIVVDGPEDLAAARELQQKISIRQVVEMPPKPFAVKATTSDDAENFLAVVNEMLARSPGGKGHMAREWNYTAVGVGSGVTPTPEQIAMWKAYLPKGIANLKEKFLFRDLVHNGWGYQDAGRGRGGVDRPAPLGHRTWRAGGFAGSGGDVFPGDAGWRRRSARWRQQIRVARAAGRRSGRSVLVADDVSGGSRWAVLPDDQSDQALLHRRPHQGAGEERRWVDRHLPATRQARGRQGGELVAGARRRDAAIAARLPAEAGAARSQVARAAGGEGLARLLGQFRTESSRCWPCTFMVRLLDGSSCVSIGSMTAPGLFAAMPPTQPSGWSESLYVATSYVPRRVYAPRTASPTLPFSVSVLVAVVAPPGR